MAGVDITVVDIMAVDIVVGVGIMAAGTGPERHTMGRITLGSGVMEGDTIGMA